jgi:hypothetical protein
MNAAGQMQDVTTMVHEGGHAVHSFLAHNLELTSFKEYPMEIAEVASMAMELMSMEGWDVFFDNADDLKRAQRTPAGTGAYHIPMDCHHRQVPALGVRKPEPFAGGACGKLAQHPERVYADQYRCKRAGRIPPV